MNNVLSKTIYKHSFLCQIPTNHNYASLHNSFIQSHFYAAHKYPGNRVNRLKLHCSFFSSHQKAEIRARRREVINIIMPIETC